MEKLKVEHTTLQSERDQAIAILKKIIEEELKYPPEAKKSGYEGYVIVIFTVDEEGKVSGFRFLEVVEAGEIQKGFTLNAIKAASIPKMPPVLEKDLDGEPLELIYNFYF